MHPTDFRMYFDSYRHYRSYPRLNFSQNSKFRYKIPIDKINYTIKIIFVNRYLQILYIINRKYVVFHQKSPQKRAFWSLIFLVFLERDRKLIGARCVFKSTANTRKSFDSLVNRHSCNESRYTLCIAGTTTVVLG